MTQYIEVRIITQKDKILLIKQAEELTTLGIRVERAREKLRRLVDKGIPYSDQGMIRALNDFKEQEAEWKLLEQYHLATREKLQA